MTDAELIKSIPGFDEELDDDHRRLIEIIGLEKYFRMVKEFAGTSVYFSRSFVTKAAKHWIQDHPDVPPAEIARRLRINIKTVYRLRSEVLSQDK